MERLSIISNRLSKAPVTVDSAIDYLGFPTLLSKEEDNFRREVRSWLAQNVAPTINDYVQRAEFPAPLVEKLKEVKLFHRFLQPPFGNAMSTAGIGAVCAELSRVDAGFATFAIVQWGLLMSTIEILGSEEQKQKYLPRLRDLQLIGGWGLTEGQIGSDASSLQTTVTKVQGGYRLNGDQRWIGNGNRDLLVVWARNTENKKVEGFIVDMKSQGITSQVIKHKLALRIVQNCHIHFNNVFIPDDSKMPKANDFVKGTNAVLKHSRVFVCWIAVGIALGVYDNTIKYITERKQFGVPISSFQLQQEKLVRIMSNTQAMLFSTWRMSQMVDQGKATMGQIAMTQAWVTDRGREVARLGREMLGGNGIIFDHYCMKALGDMQAVYSYEGTYDINALVAGRELTGIPAFQASGK